MPGTPQLAVFDMVGTTVRAGYEVPSAFAAAFRAIGVALSDDEITGIRGRSKREAVVDLLAVHRGSTEAAAHAEVVYARFQEELRAAYRARTQAIPGAEAAFRFLRGAEVDVVLTTGLDRQTAMLLLAGLGWALPGIAVVTGDDVRRGRPAPDLIHEAMRRHDTTDPAHVLVVGDTTADLAAASAAEVGWSVGVLSGAHSRAALETVPHSVILESVQELPAWLRQVAWPTRDLRTDRM